MAELRCNKCAYLKDGFCCKLSEALPSHLAKLFYGGAESILAGTLTYPSECGVEKGQKEPQLQIFIRESVCEEEETILADPSLLVDNSDW
jgi:hypothetical protein